MWLAGTCRLCCQSHSEGFLQLLHAMGSRGQGRARSPGMRRIYWVVPHRQCVDRGINSMWRRRAYFLVCGRVELACMVCCHKDSPGLRPRSSIQLSKPGIHHHSRCYGCPSAPPAVGLEKHGSFTPHVTYLPVVCGYL